MKRINEEAAKEYINYCKYKHVDNNMMKNGIIFAIVIALFGLLPGIVLGWPYYIHSIILWVIAVIYTIFAISAIKRKVADNFDRQFMRIGVFGICIGTMCVLLAMEMAYNLTSYSWLAELVSIISICLALSLYFPLTINSIKKRKFDNKSPIVVVATASIVPGIIGMGIGKILVKELSNDFKIWILVIALTGFAIALLLTTINFLRVYLVRKYNISQDDKVLAYEQRQIDKVLAKEQKIKDEKRKKYASNSLVKDLKKHISDSKKY